MGLPSEREVGGLTWSQIGAARRRSRGSSQKFLSRVRSPANPSLYRENTIHSWPGGSAMSVTLHGGRVVNELTPPAVFCSPSGSASCPVAGITPGRVALRREGSHEFWRRAGSSLPGLRSALFYSPAEAGESGLGGNFQEKNVLLRCCHTL